MPALFRSILDWFNHFRSLWSEPRENAPEIILTLAILVIILGILFILYNLIRSFFRVSEEDLAFGDIASIGASRRDMIVRLALYFGALIGALLLIVLISIPLTSSSSFCGKSCHSMNPDYQSWRRSNHASVSCVSCHGSGGVTGGVREKLSESMNIFKEISGRYSRPINEKSDFGQKNIDDGVCLNCHPFNKRKLVERRGQDVNKVYIKHADAGLKCVTCHNRVAHEGAERYDPVSSQKKYFSYIDYSRMDAGCLRCHKTNGIYVNARGRTELGPYKAAGGAVAPTKCGTCHNKNFDVKPKVHGGITEVHRDAGKQDPSLCKSCHGSMRSENAPFHKLHLTTNLTKLTCTICHKSVDLDLRSVSGKVEVDRKVCVKCHVDKFPAYTSLHQRSDWMRLHMRLRGPKTGGADIPSMSQLEANYPNCFSCHAMKELNFCRDCHQFHPHNNAWINGGHGKRALKTDFMCVRCHDKNTWCATQCHNGITQPHVANWYVLHREEAKNNRYKCAKCHRVDNGRYSCGNRCHHDPFRKQFDLSEDVPWKIGKEQHGVVAKATTAAPCLRCHEQKTWCATQCHGGITMTHVSNWRNIHYTYDRNLCVKCHNKDGTNNNFCFSCHHKDYGDFKYPIDLMRFANKTFGIDKPSKEEGGSAKPCEKCHGAELKICKDCHPGGAIYRFLGVQDEIPESEQRQLRPGIDSMFKNGRWP